jgi:hypothetical protein
LLQASKPSATASPQEGATSASCFPPESTVQHTFSNGATYTLHAFSGKYVQYELPDSWMVPGALSSYEIRQLVDVTDMLYAQMAELVDGEPFGDGLLTISVNPDDMGLAGLGCIGCKGLELTGGLLSIIKRDVDIETPNAFVYHEMSHNFDIYSQYLEYYDDGVHAWTGFLQFYMPFYNRAGDYLGGSEDELERMLSKDIVPWDALGAAASWATCVRNGGGCEASGVKANDAWAGLLLRFARLHGTSAMLGTFAYLKDYVATHPVPPSTPEEKNDLLILALAAGAGINITCELDTWHWEFSQTVRTQLAQDYPGTDASCSDGDGDGYSPAQRDYNDQNAAIHPGAAEVKNGLDDDCDGVIDDLLVVENGDFANDAFVAATVDSPARITGQATTDADIDAIQTSVGGAKYVKARLQSFGGFNGSFQLGSKSTGGFGVSLFDFAADSVTNFDSSVPLHENGLAVILPASSTSGPYELILDPKAPTPANPVHLDTPTGLTSDPVQISATINTGKIADETPTEVRFWANGVGFIQTLPIAPNVSFAWTPPDGYCSDGIRAQLLAGDHPVSSATSLNPALGNISTRVNVGTSDNVLIGGFIVSASQAKRVLIRATGPSLPVTGALADPVLELHDSTHIITTNDNWRDTDEQAIIDSGLPPVNDKESAIITTLDPGAYTAIVSGANGTTGLALVEVYDLDATVDSKLANISTRGLVQNGDNVMIAGVIVLGDVPANTIIRALGPSLAVTGPLADPTLELHDSSGAIVASNDNWKKAQQADIEATGLAPNDDRESTILMTLTPDSYTAIVRGKNDTTGVALVEVYNVSP